MENIVRKGEIACNKQFLLFSQCFLPYMALIFHFKYTLKCRLQFVSIWTSLKFWVNTCTYICVCFQYDCCGVEDYTDFQRGNKWWEKPDHLTPYMCCKVFPKTVAEGQSCAGASNTASVSTIEETNNYNQVWHNWF